MSWVEVKHALNSTVGTDNFESLDKIFKGHWRLTPSEYAYLTTPIVLTEAGTRNYDVDKKIKFNAKGRIVFGIGIRVNFPGNQNRTVTAEIYEDGTLINSTERTYSNAGEYTLLLELDVKKNSTYSFKIKISSAANLSGRTLLVNAQPVYTEELVEVI
jgi:hypothetical protein